MTAKPRCWPPEPGSGLWPDQSGHLWERYVPPGQPGDGGPVLLRCVVTGEVLPADTVWDSYGPLVMPQALAAALRREAHDIECRTSAATAAPGGPRGHAERLYKRAERIAP